MRITEAGQMAILRESLTRAGDLVALFDDVEFARERPHTYLSLQISLQNIQYKLAIEKAGGKWLCNRCKRFR